MQNKTRVKEELEKWADRCLGLAKTKHKEVTNGKALTDFDLQSLVAIKTRLTAAWSKRLSSSMVCALSSAINAWHMDMI